LPNIYLLPDFESMELDFEDEDFEEDDDDEDLLG
jgi:hypothetical protein